MKRFRFKTDGKDGESREIGTTKLILSGLGLFVVSLLFGEKREAPSARPSERLSPGERKFRRLIFQGWLIVCGIAIAFAVYGMFAYLVIGDKGTEDWDFGGVQDIPGGSVHSTFPYRMTDAESEAQHVDERPPEARTDIVGPPPTPGKIFQDPVQEGLGAGETKGEYGR